jgi:hypothetical protein
MTRWSTLRTGVSGDREVARDRGLRLRRLLGGHSAGDRELRGAKGTDGLLAEGDLGWLMRAGCFLHPRAYAQARGPDHRTTIGFLMAIAPDIYSSKSRPPPRDPHQGGRENPASPGGREYPTSAAWLAIPDRLPRRKQYSSVWRGGEYPSSAALLSMRPVTSTHEVATHHVVSERIVDRCRRSRGLNRTRPPSAMSADGHPMRNGSQ